MEEEGRKAQAAEGSGGSVPEGAAEAEPAPTTAAPPLGTRCSACGRPVDAGDPFCRYCGHRRKRTKTEQWFYRPLWIAVLAVTVLGPFALPLVWRSPFMGRGAKTFWIATILAYTALIFWAFAAMMIFAIRHINKTMDVMNQI